MEQSLIRPFNFNGKDIRVIPDENGNPTFCGLDVTDILGYSNGRDAIAKHCDQDGVAIRDVIDSMGRNQQNTFISEGNLYRLILKSRKKEAKDFEKFVCDTVLPEIRRNGSYQVAPMSEDQMLLASMKILHSRIERQTLELDQAKTVIKEQAPKVKFYDEMIDGTGCYIVMSVAKDFNMTANALNKLLHQKGIQFKRGGEWMLYDKYIGQGLTKSTTYGYPDGHGGMAYKKSMLWTDKGRVFIYDLLKPADLQQTG